SSILLHNPVRTVQSKCRKCIADREPDFHDRQAMVKGLWSNVPICNSPRLFPGCCGNRGGASLRKKMESRHSSSALVGKPDRKCRRFREPLLLVLPQLLLAAP